MLYTKYHARTTGQVMGQLPSVRLKPEKLFLKSGVDYAGPFSLRASSGRGIKSIKGYICLFVCLVTKAAPGGCYIFVNSKFYCSFQKVHLQKRSLFRDVY